nr:MAG TPA: hypothetical protein [Caudoviricetes sp.]
MTTKNQIRLSIKFCTANRSRGGMVMRARVICARR